MGRAPHPRKAFYKSVEDRVRRIWISVGASEDERAKLMEKREQERTSRFEPSVPFSADLAPCLWDSRQGRSMANRYFRNGK